MAAFRLFAGSGAASSKAVSPPTRVAPPPRVATLAERARLAAELAERAWRPVDPLRYGSGVATAVDLHRQGVHWTLLALRELGEEPRTPPSGSGVVGVELVTLWDAADQKLLEGAAGGASQLVRLRGELVAYSYLDLAERTAREQADLLERLSTFSKALLASLEPSQNELERIWVRRMAWTISALTALVLLVFAARALRDWYESRHDLAALAAWVPSSTYGIGGCPSPKQNCESSPNYFFHTLNEENPRIVFDLGSKQQISTVVVSNRRDCCKERAVPLVIEVSTDKKRWQEVARQSSTFDVWRADFPRVRARWVRLYVAQHSVLHLHAVRVLR